MCPGLLKELLGATQVQLGLSTGSACGRVPGGWRCRGSPIALPRASFSLLLCQEAEEEDR